MKKILCLVLAVLAFSLCFVSCSKGEDESSGGNKSPEKSFIAEITSIYHNNITVRAIGGQEENLYHDYIIFSKKDLEQFSVEIGDFVEIFYNGNVVSGKPSEVTPVSWVKCVPSRENEYAKEYMTGQYKEKREDDFLTDGRVVLIYKNCFFISFEHPRRDTKPYTAKINGALPEGIDVGDTVLVSCTNIWLDEQNNRVEAELKTVDKID